MERLDTGQPPLIYGDGSQTMDFVYVDDAARATILALASNVSDEVLNVASGVETSLNELAAALSGVMNVRRPSEHALERKVNAVTRRLAERAERMLGFTASVPRGRSGPPGRMVAHGASARVTAVRTLIPVARPLGEREADAARRAISPAGYRRGQVAAFEREFAAAVEASHACAVSSCTTALHLALVAVGPGDEVVTVSHSFIANAIRYCGATPVFVDVELDTFNVDVSQLEAAIGPRTRAILAVHQLGNALRSAGDHEHCRPP